VHVSTKKKTGRIPETVRDRTQVATDV